MIRKTIQPRDQWQKEVEKLGFLFHTPDGDTYWNECVCYEFSSKEIDTIEQATNSLQEICAEAVQRVIDHDWYERLGISKKNASLIEQSWNEDHLSIYGRFDLSWNQKSPPKMLEYNADTPTSLYEAAIVQWFWLEQVFPHYDQFNSLHERLVERWKDVANVQQPLYFSCLQNHADDITQTEYLRDAAHQAGFRTEFLFIEDMGFNHSTNLFVDLEEEEIRQCFKLYPWDWLQREQFGAYISHERIKFIEPAWKTIMSNKGFVAVLWELFPDHPNLLPSYFERPTGGKFVEKPFISREGNCIKVWEDSVIIRDTEGLPEAAGSVYQAYHELPCFEGRYPVIGSWIIGEESAGMGIREDDSVITQSTSHFIPHYISARRR